MRRGLAEITVMVSFTKIETQQTTKIENGDLILPAEHKLS
jgi:hypothetical protein